MIGGRSRATDEIREEFPALTTIIPHHQVKGTKDRDSWDSTYGPMQLFAHMDFEWKLTTLERNVRFQLSFLSNSEPVGDLVLERDPESLIYRVIEKGMPLQKLETDQVNLEAMKGILNKDGKLNQSTFMKACKEELDIGKDLFKRLAKLGLGGYSGGPFWQTSKTGNEVFYESTV